MNDEGKWLKDLSRDDDWEKKEYKKDSTKGSSLINPISYKGDVMVQVWMDSRVLATLCRWMESEGEYPRFLSHIVRMPLEMLIDHLVEEKRVEIVDDTLEARTLLKGRFHVSLNKGRKGMKNLLHNVTLSGKRGTDFGKGEAIDYTRHDMEKPVEKLSQEEARAKYFKEEARKKQEMKDAVKADVEKARNCGITVEGENKEERLTKLVETANRIEEIESGESKLSREEVIVKVQAEKIGEVFIPESGPVVKEGMTDEEYEVKVKEIKERDKVREELEKSAEIDESNIVRS